MSRKFLISVTVGLMLAGALLGGLPASRIATSLAFGPLGLGDPGYTELASIKTDGAQGNGDSSHGTVASGGRYVAFSSSASNLVDGDVNSSSDVFLRDRASMTTARVSVAGDGTGGNNHSHGPSISSDGSRVAFYSQASNLVAGDTNGTWDVFVRTMGNTIRVSVATDGTEGNEGEHDAGHLRRWTFRRLHFMGG